MSEERGFGYLSAQIGAMQGTLQEIKQEQHRQSKALSELSGKLDEHIGWHKGQGDLNGGGSKKWKNMKWYYKWSLLIAAAVFLLRPEVISLVKLIVQWWINVGK